METQWPRWMAKWLFQKELLWLSTALIQPLGTPFFSGMSNILEKAHSSSWKPRRPTRREATKVLKPHTKQKPPPFTWRKPQSKRQTRLCTTVFWVTQWRKLQGELITNSEQQRGLDAECLWPFLVPAEFMVVCRSVSGWYKHHTNV